MSVDKSPLETSSSVEFILNTLSRSLKTEPKQAASLLTKNNELFIKLCMKGVKSDY